MEIVPVWRDDMLIYLIGQENHNENKSKFKGLMLVHFPTKKDYIQKGELIKANLPPALVAYFTTGIPKGTAYELYLLTNEIKGKQEKTQEDLEMMTLRVKLLRKINDWFNEIMVLLYGEEEGKPSAKKSPIAGGVLTGTKTFLDYDIHANILKVSKSCEKQFIADRKKLLSSSAGNVSVIEARYERINAVFKEILELSLNFKREEDERGTMEALRNQEIIDFLDSQPDEEVSILLGLEDLNEDGEV